MASIRILKTLAYSFAWDEPLIVWDFLFVYGVHNCFCLYLAMFMAMKDDLLKGAKEEDLIRVMGGRHKKWL